MTRYFQVCLILLILAGAVMAQSDSVAVKFLLARFDYQSMESKNLYYYQQPFNPSRPGSGEELYGECYVRVEPAGDFGSTFIRSRTTGDTVYYATTIWDGVGEHIFPPPEYEIDSNPSSDRINRPLRVDVVDCFFNPEDSARVDTIFRKAMGYACLSEFENQPYNALLYLHYFSVGGNDPTTAEWIVLFYTIPKALRPLKRSWINISGNLKYPFIKTIAPHTGYKDSLLIGTTQCAFSSSNGGRNWQPVQFDPEFKTTVSVIENCRNPYVLSPVPTDITYLGTVDYTLIPEDRNGRVFHRFVDCCPWDNLKFPNIALTAIGIDHRNPEKIYAAAHNPFYQKGGLFRFHPNTGWQQLPIKPELTADSCTIRINCISVDPVDTNHIFIGTAAGLYFTRDYGRRWEHRLGNFNIVSILIPEFQSKTIWAATSGTSRSDGIYRSEDGGGNWSVQHWCCKIVDLIPCNPAASDSWNMFMAAYDRGVFVSDYSGKNWGNITGNLKDLKITALALDGRDLHGLYVGTESAIYKYKSEIACIDLGVGAADLAYWPQAPSENDRVKIYADIHNHSKIPIRNVDVAFFDNADGVLPVVVPIDTITISVIPADSFMTITAKWSAQSGENRIFVHVDPRNTIREANETNNLASIDIWVEPAVSDYQWENISGNLPNLAINDISTHPFFPWQPFIATDGGAFMSSDAATEVWERVQFCNQKAIKVTQIASEPHPFLDWTVPVVYVGTEEYTDIPEDRFGRIIRSEDGGFKWSDTGFKKLAVTALKVPASYSLNAYAGAWSPFYHKSGFFALQDSLWKELLIVYGDSAFFRINCIEIDHFNSNILYIGSSLGFITMNLTGPSLVCSLAGFNVVSIVKAPGLRGELYAATGGRSKSDGVYLGKNGGQDWKVIQWQTNIVEMCSGSLSFSTTGHLYLAAYDAGVYASHDGGFNWKPMNKGLDNKKVTCLATDRFDPNVAYLGTEKGMYMYKTKTTGIIHEYNSDNSLLPNQVELLQNYPNPFNQQTLIRYEIPRFAEPQKVSLEIYNLLGQQVRLLVDEIKPAGFYKIDWDGTNLNGRNVESGVYFYQLRIGQQVVSKKLVLVR